MIRVDKPTIEQINRALQSLESLSLRGGSASPSTGASGQLSSVNWDNIINKPSAFPPEAHDDPLQAHTHPISEVDGLQQALDDAGGGQDNTAALNDHEMLNLMGGY